MSEIFLRAAFGMGFFFMFSRLIWAVVLRSFPWLHVPLDGYTTFAYLFINAWMVRSPLFEFLKLTLN